MKTIAIAAVAALLTTAAQAETSTTSCGRTYMDKYECTTTVRRAPRPSGPVEMLTKEEVEAFNSAWDAYCQPKRGAPNRYGVVHLIYAHPGCEFGATEAVR